ncbi:MAG: transglycosylase SLT domain-containing protein [Burkholderiales bacterium]|nr:transglycosylase SLT domain-containing protein [Burkholderiales bacterium]
MGLPAALATCVATAALHYGVAPARLDAVVLQAQSHPASDRLGVTGIPVAWLPYLRSNGFDLGSVASDPCENIVAGAWILAYTDRLNERLRRWDRAAGQLPARARPWQPAIRWVAAQAGLSVALIDSVIYQESRFHPEALGPRTRSGERAVGLMQLLPSTARALHVDAHNPLQNIWGGTWYLANLVRAYGGDEGLALAAYNSGPGAVAKYGGIPPYRQTQDYVPSVIERARQYARNGDE